MMGKFKLANYSIDIYFLFLIFFYFLHNINLFPLNLIPPMNLHIGDGQAIIALKNCPYGLDELYKGINSCDPYNRPFNYPHLIYYLSKFFLVIPYKIYLLINSIIYLLGVNIFLKRLRKDFPLLELKKWFNFFKILFLFNYPLMLCIERGNYEFFVICLILFANIGLTGKNKFKELYSIALISIGGFIKFYPLFSLLGINIYNLAFNQIITIKKFISSFYMPLIILISIIPSFNFMIINTPKTEGGLGFGLLCLYQTELKQFSVIFLAIKLLILVFTLIYSKISKIIFKDNIMQSSAIEKMFILNSFNIIFVYFLSRSYDYRLAVFVPILPICLYFIDKDHLIINFKIVQLNLNNFILLLIGSIFFVDGYLALASWPPSSMNLFAALFRVFNDFIVHPILIGIILKITLVIFQKLIYTSKSKFLLN